MLVTGVACLNENYGRRIDLQEFIWKRWKIIGGQQLARLTFGLCQGARLCSSSSISPLRLDVPLPLRGSVPSLRMQFAPGCNKCRNHWKFRGWRSRRRQTDRAELGQVRHQFRSTSGQVRFVLLRETKAHLCLISRLFLPPTLSHPCCPFPFSLFFLYLHYSPLFRPSPTLFFLSPTSCCVEPRCLSCSHFLPPCFSFCPFVVSVSSSSPIRLLFSFSLVHFTLSRLMHSYRKLQVKTFR